MEVIYILLPLALGLALFFLAAYIWAVRNGQFDDSTTPAYRILIEDSDKSDEKPPADKKSHEVSSF
jgi:cbb3-type cytochrome oxidase maturation protein